jgi:hypothetical protein
MQLINIIEKKIQNGRTIQDVASHSFSVFSQQLFDFSNDHNTKGIFWICHLVFYLISLKDFQNGAIIQFAI